MTLNSSTRKQSTVVSDVVHHSGLRYANLTDAGSPSSSVRPVRDTEPQPSGSNAVFPQLPSRLRQLMGPAVESHPQSHNAFFLNVTAPQRGKKLPVLMFIHGGAWSTGGGSVRWYDGHDLAAAGMIVVTVNYRLGAAGHIRSDDEPHGPLNELILALRWIRDSIEYYGGDPENITVAGQSAGAWYAWALAQVSQASGLMRRVALWSLPDIQPWNFAQRRSFSQQVLGDRPVIPHSFSEYRQVMERGNAELASFPSPLGAMPPMYLPAEKYPVHDWLRRVHNAVQRLHVRHVYVRHTAHEMTPFLPKPDDDKNISRTLAAVQGRVRQDTIHDQWATDLLARDDSPHDQMVQQATWESYGRTAAAISELANMANLHIVPRRFRGRSETVGLGSPHCFDLPFQFNNLANWHDAPMLKGLDLKVAERWAQELRDDLLEFMHGDSSSKPEELGT